MDQVTIDPSEFPSVDLGGKKHILKFTAGSILRLKRYGLELDDLKAKPVTGSEAIERIVRLVQAACPELGNLSTEAVADMMDPLAVKVYADAVNEAIKKAFPQAETANPAPSIQ